MTLLGSAAITSLAACGGGGGSSVPPASVGTSAPAGGKTASVSFVVDWPKPGSAASVRHRDYLSNSTASVTLAITGEPLVTVTNPNLTPGTTKAFTQSTTVAVPAPTGTDTFTASSYDAASNLLGQATAMDTVVIDTVNTFTVTLNGNLAKIAVAATPSTFLSGTFPTYTVVGQSPQTFTLTPEDADGNVIISPGMIPPLTLTSGAPASVTATKTQTTNQYAVQSLVEPETVTLTAAGKNLAGTAVTTTFTVTTVAAIYVANFGNAANAAAPESVTIYPATATGNATPIATLSGSKTLETAVQFPAVDSNGVLYVSNLGPLPGTNIGPTSGFVSIFTPAVQNGNNAPSDMISNLQRPEGLSVDASGDLWVMLERSIAEYPPSPGAGSATIASIGGPNPTSGARAPTNNTGVDGCYGLYVSPTTSQIYTACSDVYNVFAKGTTGNTAPIYQVAPPTSAIVAGMETYGSDSWLGVVADSSGNVYLPGFNNNDDNISEYSATANDSMMGTGMTATFTAPTPTFIASGTGFSMPVDVAIDSSGAIYVTNNLTSTVEIFSSATTLKTGIPTTTISGAATGLNGPYGIAVR